MAQLVTRHGLHRTLCALAERGMAAVFSTVTEIAEAAREGALEKLHAKIG